jgi:DNA-binding GntR family transcriptional regulator
MLEHVSLPEAVGRELRHRILNNELPAETRLVEANLAAEFGVSRGTIRDAMRSLQAEGLIAIVPRRYSVVTRMSPEDAEDICYARYVLEDACVGDGLWEQRDGVVEGMRASLEEMAAAAAANDMGAIVELDTQFHQLLVETSGRRRVKDLWSMLDSQMGALMRSSMEHQGIDLAEAVERHRVLAEVMATGDAAALRRALRDHYVQGFPERSFS